MSDQHNPVTISHHLLFAGLIIGLVVLIAVFFTRFPMACQVGYTLATGTGSSVCVKGATAKR